ncbi:hypothetical protein NBRC10512_001578 [Rhodotorula toruloides]|uniref:RHTO0S12e03950g1_1 n=2 Tax=Rhodotorula toruloides TaxID=5286 RepID=A0A061BER3_RHOTO|nr:uncharacterized protein RHTO_07506 [Rhodotorula toruloides NP11]EMS23164.1 hypothetical protein RHTO_07506 [Rhodotorula toruloides NP11]CDR46386.1 RHTO0S12e03950g1_1 [Rhodotorula toruloides]
MHLLAPVASFLSGLAIAQAIPVEPTTTLLKRATGPRLTWQQQLSSLSSASAASAAASAAASSSRSMTTATPSFTRITGGSRKSASLPSSSTSAPVASATPFSSLVFEGRSYNVTWQRRYNLSDVVWPLSATCDGYETVDKDSRAWLCDDFLANHHVPLTAFCHKTVHSVYLGGVSAGFSETNIIAGSMPAPFCEGDGFAKPGPYNFYLGWGYGEEHSCREDGHGCDIKFDFPDVDFRV